MSEFGDALKFKFNSVRNGLFKSTAVDRQRKYI